MPTVSYDGQSYSVDGKRVWLVSGSVHYARVPRELWRDRIRSAKQAGLNCIDTYVFWNLHENKPGKFDFEDELDLRHFIKLIDEEGMYCILRPGPYIGADWDFGGLPPWLHGVKDVALRQPNGPFLEACSRYLGAVMDQVKDLQVTSAPSSKKSAEQGRAPGKPILLMQIENRWFCHNPEAGQGYLRELARYLRENGAGVPIIECNNLWQDVDGTLAAWCASDQLTEHLRQLRVVQPEAPRLVAEYWPGAPDHWDSEHRKDTSPAAVGAALAQILAAGAQYNICPFHGGTNFGFNAGRSPDAPDAFVTTSYDCDAPLTEAGGRTGKYKAVKRVSVFASQFDHVLANLDNDAPPHAAASPGAPDHPVSVVHQRGGQGDVIFIFKGEKDRTKQVEVMLPDGRTVPVPLSSDPCAWIGLNINLGGVCELSLTNLRPWAFINKQMLVLFGPAGAEGMLAIDESLRFVKVPSGQTPLVEQHEEITVVVLNEKQVDAAYVQPRSLIVGAAGLDEDGDPIADPAWSSVYTIRSTGDVEKESIKPAGKPTNPKLTDWGQVKLDDMVTGQSPRYEPIEGPAGLAELKANFGYGWYKLAFKGGKTRRVMVPEAADRVHVYAEGKLVTTVGVGPAAQYDAISIKADGDVMFLADNLGRFSDGWGLGEKKGLFGHVCATRLVRLTKPNVTSGVQADLFAAGQFFTGASIDDRPPGDTLTWNVKPSGRKPLIFDIQGLPMRAVFLVNGEAVGAYDPAMSGQVARFVLQVGEQITGGKNDLSLALFEELNPKLDLTKHVTVYEVTDVLSAKTPWFFAPWEQPPAEAFEPFDKAVSPLPCWLRATFTVDQTDTPLWLDPAGMTKGQVFLNGHNVGRYFVAARTGRSGGPQQRYYLPEPWLHTDQPNELVLFDEHGKDPSKCSLVYDAMGPYGK